MIVACLGEFPLSQPIDIAVAGALGRMGQAVATVISGRQDVRLAARFDRPGTAEDSLVEADAALAVAQVVIDFTTPAASVALAQSAASRGGPALVIGSTGCSEEQLAAIAQASKSIAIVHAGNYSLGVNMLMGMVAKAARALGPEVYDIEIFEAHHKRKVDAPSGTALMLGEAAANSRGRDLKELRSAPYDGITGPRETGKIGFASLRAGGVIGDHTVMFASEDEMLTLSHSAMDRSLFAKGAVAAAAWVRNRRPGLYDMQDVLGFRQA